MKPAFDCLEAALLGLWFCIPALCLVTTMTLAQDINHTLADVKTEFRQ